MEHIKTHCAAEGCQAWYKNHYWNRVRAEGWFQQKSGLSWCPQHVPEWVEEWRKSRTPTQEET